MGPSGTHDGLRRYKRQLVAQLMDCLPSMPRALGWFPASHKLSMIEHAFNSGTWVVEAGRSKTQGHPLLHSEFEASLGYIIPVFPPTKFTFILKCLKVWVWGSTSFIPELGRLRQVNL